MAIISCTKLLRLRSASLQTARCKSSSVTDAYIPVDDNYQSRETTVTMDSSSTKTATAASSSLSASAEEGILDRLKTVTCSCRTSSSTVIRPQNSFVFLRRPRPASLTSQHHRRLMFRADCVSSGAAGDTKMMPSAMKPLLLQTSAASCTGRIYAPKGALLDGTSSTYSTRPTAAATTDSRQQVFSYLKALNNRSNVFIPSGPRGCRLILPLRAASVTRRSRGDDLKSQTTTAVAEAAAGGNRCRPIYPAMALSKVVPLVRLNSSRLDVTTSQKKAIAAMKLLKETSSDQESPTASGLRKQQVLNISSSSEIFEVAVYAGD